MNLKAELLKETFMRIIRYILMNVLKLVGFKLWLAIKITDTLWISVIAPFISQELRNHKRKVMAVKRQKRMEHIKSITTKHNFKQEFAKMFQKRKTK